MNTSMSGQRGHSKRFSQLLLTVVLLAGTAACGRPIAGYEERVANLQTAASRGVQNHHRLVAQAAPRIDEQRCGDAFTALDYRAQPVAGTGPVYDPWYDQLKAFFVDSCVSGNPRPVEPQDVP